MKEGYFRRVMKQTPTVFWVNNPTRDEARWAIEAGATGCTCNPSFCQKMVDHPTEGPHARKLLDEAIRESRNDSEAEAILQRKLVRGIAEVFRPVYDARPKHQGYVSIQGDPIEEHDPQVIIHEARLNRAIAPNACIKIPCTTAGMTAMETLIAEDTPINATEIFAASQVISFCELLEQARSKSGTSPKVYVSHIAGIYDEYLQKYVEREKIDISPDALYQAGLAVTRKVYRIVKERDYHVTFIGGGARGLQHFTEMVGGDVVVTINWQGSADKLLEQDPPVMYRLFNPVEQYVIDELMEKLPDFRRGYLDDGLKPEEFAEFGPVELFRSMFIKSWKRVLDLSAQRRAAM